MPRHLESNTLVLVQLLSSLEIQLSQRNLPRAPPCQVVQLIADDRIILDLGLVSVFEYQQRTGLVGNRPLRTCGRLGLRFVGRCFMFATYAIIIRLLILIRLIMPISEHRRIAVAAITAAPRRPAPIKQSRTAAIFFFLHRVIHRRRSYIRIVRGIDRYPDRIEGNKMLMMVPPP